MKLTIPLQPKRLRKTPLTFQIVRAKKIPASDHAGISSQKTLTNRLASFGRKQVLDISFVVIDFANEFSKVATVAGLCL